MQLYSCKVRLSGSLYHEVPKTEVTAAEIAILRAIHGFTDPETGNIDPSCVVDIVATGNVDRSDAEERDRLSIVYNAALKRFGTSVAKFFGIGTPLPKFAEGADKTIVPEEPIRRGPGRPPKPLEASAA